MTTPNTLCGRCGDARFAHETELAPQCAASGCTCLAFKLPLGLRAVPTPDPNGRPIRVMPFLGRAIAVAAPQAVQAAVRTAIGLPPATVQLLDAAAASPYAHTRNAGVKLAQLINDLRSRLETEQLKAAAQARRVATRDAAAEQRRANPAGSQRSVRKFSRGPRVCGVDGCTRESDGPASENMHRRRAHENWGHVGRPPRVTRAQEQTGHDLQTEIPAS